MIKKVVNCEVQIVTDFSKKTGSEYTRLDVVIDGHTVLRNFLNGDKKTLVDLLAKTQEVK